MGQEASQEEKNTMRTVGVFEFDAENLLGHGAFGTVYKGRTKDDHSYPVAIKRMLTGQMAEKEIKIMKDLSRIHHRNTVRMFDCLRSDEFVFVVMEFCNGGSLEDYLEANNNRLPVSTMRIFLKQIADGMKCLVAQGICHRDLKPQNLLLSHDAPQNYPDPEDITLKIADFGLARFIEPGADAMTCCGTIIYMAPEVFLRRPYDNRADLWSIGVIVYECLMGCLPTDVKTLIELMGIHMSATELDLPLLDTVPPSLKALLLSLLKKDPGNRIKYEQFFKHPFLTEHSEDMAKKVPDPPSGEVLKKEKKLKLKSLRTELANATGQVSHFVRNLGKITRDSVPESPQSKLDALKANFEFMASNVTITASRLVPDSDSTPVSSVATAIASKLEAIASRLHTLAGKSASGELDLESVAPQIECVAPQLEAASTDIALILSHPEAEASDLDPVLSQLGEVASKLE